MKGVTLPVEYKISLNLGNKLFKLPKKNPGKRQKSKKKNPKQPFKNSNEIF